MSDSSRTIFQVASREYLDECDRYNRMTGQHFRRLAGAPPTLGSEILNRQAALGDPLRQAAGAPQWLPVDARAPIEVMPGTDCRPTDAEALQKEEREKLRATLQAMKPSEQPYTRRDWALELQGEMRMWERMMAALDAPERKASE